MIRKTDFIYKKQIKCNEVATILTADKNKSRLQLYLEKTGQIEIVKEELSERIEKVKRGTAAYLWSHYDNNFNENLKNHIRVNTLFENKNCYTNDKYDWLVSEPQNFILKDGKRIGILHCGKFENLESDMLNVQSEMIVHEMERAEIVYLTDNDFVVCRVTLDEFIVDEILDATEKFFKLISEAQTILYNLQLAKESNDDTTIKFYAEQLNEVEPLPEDTDAYKKFISTRTEVDKLEIKKEDRLFDEFHNLALGYLYAQDKLKLVQSEFADMEAKILRSMRGSQQVSIGEKYEFYQQNGILSLNIK